MSKVRAQLSELTRHLYEQHQASKSPAEVQNTIALEVAGQATAEVVVTQPYSRPLAPGVHPPMMGPVFIPGTISIREVVTTQQEAQQAMNRIFKSEPRAADWKPATEEDVPSIDEPPEVKKYSRKLEP